MKRVVNEYQMIGEKIKIKKKRKKKTNLELNSHGNLKSFIIRFIDRKSRKIYIFSDRKFTINIDEKKLGK